ncbi:flagellar protein FliT [Methylophaga lonarensis]|nr:flagellar protein FliT [Methylophaga lonarensis]
MSELKKTIGQGIALSERLIQIAEQGDWEVFQKLEPQRQALVKQLDVSTVDPDEVTQVREGLAQLISLNEQLEQLCQSQRTELLQQLQLLKKSDKARKAYQE